MSLRTNGVLNTAQTRGGVSGLTTADDSSLLKNTPFTLDVQ